MTSHTPPLVPVLLLALIGSALAGCSATSAAPAGDATGSSRSSGSAASGSAASGSAASGSADGICRYVSVDAANSAMHLQPAFTEQASGSFVNGEPECGFTTDDRSVIVNVTVFDTSVTPFSLQSGVASDETLHPVAGLGDRAAVGEFEVDVVVGSKGLVVENFGDASAVSAEQLVALAKLFVTRL